MVNPTKNLVSKKQQYQNHFQKKRSVTCHFGRNIRNFSIFNKGNSQGRVNQIRLYSAKARGFIIDKINLKKKSKVMKGNEVYRDILNITRVKNSIRRVKLIRITNLLLYGKFQKLNSVRP